MSWTRNPTAGLLLVLGALSGGGAAHAVADVTTLHFQVSVLRVENAIRGSGAIQTEVRLRGTGIARATMTPPQGAAVPLVAEGEDFVLKRPADTLQQLETVLPEGSYLFTLNDGAASIQVSYARPAVPSPAISEPLALSSVPPASVTVRFAPCATCVGADDGVEASVLEGTTVLVSALFGNVEGEEPGVPDVSEWSPPDLPETSDLVARVVHAVVRSTPLETNRSDAFEFQNAFAHGDSVPFFTAASPPDGEFCIVANDAPPADRDCFEREGPEAGLLDPSGAETIEVAGLPIFISTTVGLDGSVGGTAVTDLDGNGNQETTGIFGKLRGRRGRTTQTLAFSFELPDLGAKLGLKIQEQFSIPRDTRTRRQSARGLLDGQKVRELDVSEAPLSPDPLGWTLLFTLGDGREVTDASLALTGREPIPLAGRWNFDPELDTSAMTLLSEDGAVRVRIEELVIDDASEPPEIVSGKVRVRAFGQWGRLLLR